jgi:large subunit ribosomal protein L47
MAHIKAVLNERRLAYEGAVKLAEHQMAVAKERIVDEADRTVMEFQRIQQEEERPKARIYRARRRNLANGKKLEPREAPLGSST